MCPQYDLLTGDYYRKLTTVNVKKQGPRARVVNLGCTRVTGKPNNPKVRVADNSTGIRKTSRLRS